MKTESRKQHADKSTTATAVLENGMAAPSKISPKAAAAAAKAATNGKNGHPEAFDLAVVLTALRRMR
ncbi:MAG TPA: hypothetical protein VN688_25655, partial [Gemmataceae bacterium]|nr:hypothetical protein [Gemmataceae bacterium]